MLEEVKIHDLATITFCLTVGAFTEHKTDKLQEIGSVPPERLQV